MTSKMKVYPIMVFLILVSPAYAQYSFEFDCLDDTIVIAYDTTTYLRFDFRLQNTGSQPDSYAFDCRVIDSVPGWEEMFCVGGNCGVPGMILYDLLNPAQVDTEIDVQVFLNASYGIERINLCVNSVHNTDLRDSITIHIYKELKIKEYGTHETVPQITIAPNPGSGLFAIKVDGINLEKKCYLAIYDCTGQLIYKIPMVNANNNISVIWDGKNSKGDKVKGGVYFVRFLTDNLELIKKLVLVF